MRLSMQQIADLTFRLPHPDNVEQPTYRMHIINEPEAQWYKRKTAETCSYQEITFHKRKMAEGYLNGTVRRWDVWELEIA